MEEAKPRRRRKKKSKATKFKKELKLLLIITLLCFFAALILSFVTGKVPGFVDSVVEKQVSGAINRQMKDFGMPPGGAPGGMDLNKLRKQMGR